MRHAQRIARFPDLRQRSPTGASWFETRGVAALLTMRLIGPHPEEYRERCVSKDEATKCLSAAARTLPVGIGVDQAAPAAAVERRPLTFGLRQTISDGIDDGGMMAHAAMAALDLDVLGTGGWLFHAALPRADAVGAAEDRGGRHRGRCRNRSSEPQILFIGAAAARHLVDTPGVGRLRIACKRAAERDQRAHAIRHHLCQLARVNTAQAPA